MRIAVATEGGNVAAHFGRCPLYTLVDIESKKVINKEVVANPGHQPGLLPRFLRQYNADYIICGGMGPRAQDLFASFGIKTIIGVSGSVEKAISAFCSGTLEIGESSCDHSDSEGGHQCRH